MGLSISASVCGRCSACACVFVYICMRMHMSVGMYICAFFCSECCMHSNTPVPKFVCTFCMRVCIYVYVCMCADMYIYSIYVHFFAVSVTCTLEQLFWTLVHGQVCTLHRYVFTPTYTSANTLAAGCAHMCILIHLCICMHMCTDAYVRL